MKVHVSMPRNLLLVLAFALVAALSLPTSASAASASAAPAAAKRKVVPHWHGYGFLPGYRPPEVIERQERYLYWRRHPSYWYGGPGFYRGRWNAGGFGPCWTQTPIGPMWNCGR
jgi:hypothetical protein